MCLEFYSMSFAITNITWIFQGFLMFFIIINLLKMKSAIISCCEVNHKISKPSGDVQPVFVYNS